MERGQVDSFVQVSKVMVVGPVSDVWYLYVTSPAMVSAIEGR
jgi:hypothetical protein